MRFGEIKADTPVPLPHVNPERKNRKRVSPGVKEKAHTSILPGTK